MIFVNATESIGILVGQATTATTGSMFITLFMIFIILLALCIMMSIAMEWSGIILLPYAIACMSHYSEFVGTTAIILIYFAVIISKNFLFK